MRDPELLLLYFCFFFSPVSTHSTHVLRRRRRARTAGNLMNSRVFLKAFPCRVYPKTRPRPGGTRACTNVWMIGFYRTQVSFRPHQVAAFIENTVSNKTVRFRCVLIVSTPRSRPLKGGQPNKNDRLKWVELIKFNFLRLKVKKKNKEKVQPDSFKVIIENKINFIAFKNS